jgi:HEPN domain-containing protein
MDNLNVEKWIQFAQEDYNLVVIIVKTHGPYPVPTRIVCYHCQQSVEKILKAYIIAKEGVHAKIHDLEKLLKQCAQHSSDFDDFETACSGLNTYTTTSRYPSDITLTEQHMKQALEDAYNILEFTKLKLKEMGYEYKSEKDEN